VFRHLEDFLNGAIISCLDHLRFASGEKQSGVVMALTTEAIDKSRR